VARRLSSSVSSWSSIVTSFLPKQRSGNSMKIGTPHDEIVSDERDTGAFAGD
jgi:hypothetical protein